MKKLIYLITLFILCFNATVIAQTWSWVTPGGGNQPDLGNDILVDAYGNAYVTGTFSGTMTIDGESASSNGGTDIFIAKLDNDGNLLWLRSYGGLLDDEGMDLAFDASGNLVVLALFDREMIFGPFTVSTAGNTDMAIMKLDIAGNPISIFTDGGNIDDRAYYVAVDEKDNVIVFGYALDGMLFGGVLFPPTLGFQFFVTKYDAAGNSLWLEQSADGIPGFWGLNQIRNIEVDGDGNIYLFGHNYEAVSFAGLYIPIGGLEEAFIVKMDPNGNGLWFRDINDGEDNDGFDMDVNRAGDIVITGSADSSPVNFGNDVDGNPISFDPFDYGLDITSYVVRYNTDGGLHWARLVPAIDGQIDINDDLDIVFSGHSPYFGDPSKITVFDADGNEVWHKDLALSVNYNTVPKVELDPDLDVIAMDNFDVNLTFDGIPANNVGNEDVYVAKLSGLSPCHVGPVHFTAEINGNSALISWTGVESATLYQYRFKPATRGAWHSGTTTSNSVLIKQLSPNTDYIFQARAFCSSWSPVNEFTFNINSKFSSKLKTEEKGILWDAHKSLDLFPNPAETKLSLVIKNAQTVGKVKIYDSKGHLILQMELEQSQTSLDVSQLPKGLYFLSYENGENLITEKFIKR